MNKTSEPYPVLVRVDLLWHGKNGAEAIITAVDEIIRRHLTRIELAAQSYWGKVLSRTPQGITACFNSAEAAVLGANEMQRRCSGIRQNPEHRYDIKIGIHLDRASNNLVAIESAARRLTAFSEAGGILLSETVLDSLPEELRQKVVPVPHPDSALVAHKMNWIADRTALHLNDEIPQKEASERPCIVLRLGGKEHAFGEEKVVITVGREPRNDIVINDPKSSRNHFRIINQRNGCVLVDQSTNGTYITSSENGVVMVKHEITGLRGKGRITLGEPYTKNVRCAIEFEVIGSEP